MAKGYWVAHVDVRDPDGYQNYVVLLGDIFRKHHGPLPGAWRTHSRSMEGQQPRPPYRDRVSELLKRRCIAIASPEYRKAIAVRQASAGCRAFGRWKATTARSRSEVQP